jgi:hypothetical protein
MKKQLILAALSDMRDISALLARFDLAQLVGFTG